MSLAHTCHTCGHEWESADVATAKAIRAAAKVNGEGPRCNLCFYLEMASRHAALRGFSSLSKAVDAARAWKECQKS